MDNTAFRELVKAEIKAVGANITKRLGSARWRGSIEVRGAKYTPGEIINLTIPSVGCTAQNLRIIDVHHQMTKKGWFTTLKLEEDENVVGN
jgi:prophage tail gpP-like protein